MRSNADKRSVVTNKTRSSSKAYASRTLPARLLGSGKFVSFSAFCNTARICSVEIIWFVRNARRSVPLPHGERNGVRSLHLRRVLGAILKQHQSQSSVFAARVTRMLIHKNMVLGMRHQT